MRTGSISIPRGFRDGPPRIAALPRAYAAEMGSELYAILVAGLCPSTAFLRLKSGKKLDETARSGSNGGLHGQVAQLVEQRIENPRVGSSILPLATKIQSWHIQSRSAPSFV